MYAYSVIVKELYECLYYLDRHISKRRLEDTLRIELKNDEHC